MDQLVLFLIFLKASALSVGGLASLPLLRADLVPANVNDTQIVQALAIGRLTPGPNGLYIVSLGYLAAGWYGALAALIAASLVPLVMLPATGLSIVDASGTAPWQLVLVAIAVVLSIDGRLHPAILVAAGAVAGFAFGRP